MIITTFPNPYREEHEELISLSDGKTEIWIDAKTRGIVQIGPSANDLNPIPSGKRPVSELRMLAKRAVAILGGDPDLHKLHPMEDNRNRLTYYFRWDDFTSPIKEAELPPFIQVAITADGIITSFTNTLRKA
jgi:hypothetical protein